MLANESDLELYFSLDWEEKQFKSILKRKKILEHSLILRHFIDLQTTPHPIMA